MGESYRKFGALLIERKGGWRERDGSQTQGNQEGDSKGKCVEYWYYGKKGHIKRDCCARKKDGKETNLNEGNNDEANIVGEFIKDYLI